MNCSEVRELALSYLSKETPDGEIQSHLASCPSCARLVSEARDLDERLRASVLAETADTEALERRVMQRIALESGKVRHRIWKWALAGGLAAAAVVGALMIYRPVKPSTLFTAAARDHRMEVVDHQPRRWRLDSPAAEALASARGIPSSAIAAVTKAGYSFKEAKLCRLDGLIFLHLVYMDGGHEFSVYLRQEDGGEVTGNRHSSDSGKPIYTSDLGAEHVAGFTDGALKALVVCEQSSDAALRIAQAAARVI